MNEVIVFHDNEAFIKPLKGMEQLFFNEQCLVATPAHDTAKTGEIGIGLEQPASGIKAITVTTGRITRLDGIVDVRGKTFDGFHVCVHKIQYVPCGMGGAQVHLGCPGPNGGNKHHCPRVLGHGNRLVITLAIHHNDFTYAVFSVLMDISDERANVFPFVKSRYDSADLQRDGSLASRQAVAPPQLDPAPAVHPKQCWLIFISRLASIWVSHPEM